jgi:hypothetical protein
MTGLGETHPQWVWVGERNVMPEQSSKHEVDEWIAYVETALERIDRVRTERTGTIQARHPCETVARLGAVGRRVAQPGREDPSSNWRP